MYDERKKTMINIKPYFGKKRDIPGDDSLSNFTNNVIYHEEVSKIIFEHMYKN